MDNNDMNKDIQDLKTSDASQNSQPEVSENTQENTQENSQENTLDIAEENQTINEPIYLNIEPADEPEPIIMDEVDKPKKKKKLGEKIKESLTSFGNIFKQYPVTIGCMMLAALIAAILLDVRYDAPIYDDLVRTVAFLGIWSTGVLFTEELFRNQKILDKLKSNGVIWGIKCAMFAVFAGISFALDYIFFFEKEIFDDDFLGYLSRYLAIYCTVLVVVAIYMMFKRSKASFENYILDVFCSVIKATVVYGIIALGVLIIISIFNALIVDTDDIELLGRTELFLFAGIYFPAILLAFSRVHNQVSKFAKVVVEYVMLIILLIAFLIVYLYIGKIVLTFSLPKNEVFNILSMLFCLGIPVWTMAMCFKDEIMGKIARFVPFAFVPFIILQIICVALRVGQYGITSSRYMGIILIILEIIYVAVYAIRLGKYVDKMVFVVLAMMIIVLVVPAINMNASVVRSQSKRLNRILDKGVENLTNEEKREVRDIVYEIRYSASYEGDKYIDEHFDKAFIDEVSNWYYIDGEISQTRYYSDYQELKVLDVSKYSMMSKVTVYEYDSDFDIHKVKLNVDMFKENEDTYYDYVEVDLADCIEKLKEDEYNFLDNNNMLDIGYGMHLYMTRINCSMEGNEIISLDIEGYLFIE